MSHVESGTSLADVQHEQGGMMQNQSRSKLHLGRGLLATLVVAALAAWPLATSAAAAKPSNTVTPVLQGVSCTQAGVPVACPTLTATLTGFQAIGDQLFAKVTVTATNGTQTASQTVLVPVAAVQGTCQILHLELGPIDLDLLGLVVHVDKIVVDITAQSGPGNLLGNLLCGLANALNQGASATTIANILNQILAVLRL
jgi:hypothetical protein